VDGITCTTADCPCVPFRALSPALGSLINDQRGTDSIVYPLVAGTLARCVLVSAERHQVTLTGLSVPALAEHARLVAKLADAADDSPNWERDRDAFATIVNFVLGGWDLLLEWVPEYYVPIVAKWKEPTTAGLLKAARTWVDRKQSRRLTELVLLSADVANRLLSKKVELVPIMAKAMRPIRVELAARLRAAELTTWPRVLRASFDDWQTDTLEGLLFDYAGVGTLPLNMDTMLEEEMAWDDDEPDDPGQPDAAPAVEPSHPSEPLEPNEPREKRRLDADAEALLDDAIAQIDRAEARSRAIEAKRLELADRYASLQGRVDRLTNDLTSARQEIAGLQSELAAVRRERDELADRMVAEEALANEATAPPATAFAGCCVYLFTGHTSGQVRDEMALRFVDYGPDDVNVYDADVNRGPDAYPPNAVVVLDTTFMSHSASDYVLSRVRASHVWCFRGAYGPGRLAKAAAAAYAARRASRAATDGAGVR
jgi:hypothetical protein